MEGSNTNNLDVATLEMILYNELQRLIGPNLSIEFALGLLQIRTKKVDLTSLSKDLDPTICQKCWKKSMGNPSNLGALSP